jgi:hypothetical protein
MLLSFLLSKTTAERVSTTVIIFPDHRAKRTLPKAMSSVVRAVKLLNSLHGTTKGRKRSASDVVKASLASPSFYKFLGGAGLLTYASGFKFSYMNIEQGSASSARSEVGSISRFEFSVEQVNCCRNLTPTSVFSRPIAELN